MAVVDNLNLGRDGRHVVDEPLADICRSADDAVDRPVGPAQVAQRISV
jgi:hypothetical protein